MSASVERVIERLDLTARRTGTRWWFERCPNPGHADKNEKHLWSNAFIRADGHARAGQWTCFSCQAGGRLTSLVMAVRACTFEDAVLWLSDVEDAPAPDPVVRVRYAPMGARSRAFQLPGGVEFAPLTAWNSVPRAYAIGRGIDAQQVERWGVGYALAGRLDGRIVFPIVDLNGRLQNYAARTFTGDEVRYKAADEREGPDKAALLGERFWPRAEERARSVVVVFEGAITGMAIDRVLRDQRGVFLAGMQGSNADHPRRIERLATFGRVVSAADPDRAGDDVSEVLASSLRRVPFARVRYPRRGVDAADTDPVELAAALAEAIGS